MGGRQVTPQKQVEQYIREQLQKAIEDIIEAFCYVGEQCVARARDEGRYIDRTGNLRSSIGYVVLDNGTVIQQGGFTQVKDGKEGTEEGKRLITQLISENSQGIVLIIIAGMEYAVYVEAMGLDVLTSAELLAEKMVPETLRKLGFEVISP